MKKNHELVLFGNGKSSLKDLSVGESMHSSIGPWEEACSIHILQADLLNRLSRNLSQPLVVFDVGMGVAANAVAALHCHASAKSPRALHLVSFEIDPSGLELAILHPDHFPFLKPWDTAIRSLLKTDFWESPDRQIHWELRRGAFKDQDLVPAAEVTFFDFYSPKSQPELWSAEIFHDLYQASAPLRALNPVLTTYSAATSIRVALLLAGYSVGAGEATATKRETTVASHNVAALKTPLGKNWLKKLERSDKSLPHGYDSSRRQETLEKIRRLEQFSSF